MKLKLGPRFALIMLLTCVAGSIASWLVLSQMLHRWAEDEISAKGQVLLRSILSVRSYTSDHINPLLEQHNQAAETFIPESVPAFSARTVFDNLRANPEYQSFLYKEATLNPTNPNNRADSFEEQLIARFKAESGLPELSGFREMGGSTFFYIARPLVVGSESCLRCHSTPDVAPASLIKTYGASNGMGWQVGDLLTTQVMYVPANNVDDAADQATMIMLPVFVLIFIAGIFVFNLLLKRNVITPIGYIAGVAHQLRARSQAGAQAAPGAEGAAERQPFESRELMELSRRPDEVGQLALHFQDMVRELQAREEQLMARVAELTIQIDEARRQKQVAEIVETDYFQDLRSKAGALRRRNQRAGDQRSSDQPESGTPEPGAGTEG